MQPAAIRRPIRRRPRFARLACAATLGVAALVPLSTAAAHEQSKLKLPAERTSPTGNFFTLESYIAPTSSKPVAEFEMKVCTSSHTPAGTGIEPSFFTLDLSGGTVVPESISAAKSPAMVPKGLRPLQCTAGWLGFKVPKGKSVSKLEYEYNGKISWAVG